MIYKVVSRLLPSRLFGPARDPSNSFVDLGVFVLIPFPFCTVACCGQAKFADSTTGLYVDVWLWWEAEARGVSGADTLLLPIVASGPKTKTGLGGFDRAIPTPRDKVFPLNRCTFEHFEVWCPAGPWARVVGLLN